MAATGSIAEKMANATGDAVKNAPKAPFVLARNPFKLGKRNEFMSGTGKTTANVNVGVAYIALASNPDVVLPIDIRVVHAPSAKPQLIAALPAIRFDGSMFRPSDHLSKADAERVVASLKAFETSVAQEFKAWYSKLENVPALTARGVQSTGISGVTLDD